MELAVVGAAALVAATLTLFSGFGLGTLLMPAFALFFPVPVAVAATAVVHAANNLFKVSLLARQAAAPVLWRFGLPAVVAAFPGAWLLTHLGPAPPLLRWELGTAEHAVTPVRLLMGLLILGFAVFELVPALRGWRVGARWLPLGGALSGFFGGLSGHQGALRAAFLSPLGLAPPAFAATQAVLAVMVDAARLAVYGMAFFAARTAGLGARGEWGTVAFATACAFAGSYLGKRLLPGVRVRLVRGLTAALLVVVGLGLASGLL
jgi:uncharacterized protein